MTFVRRRVTTAPRRMAARAARGLTVVALAPGMLVAGSLATARPAVAAEAPGPGGASATMEGLKTYGQAVVRADGRTHHAGAGLFEMSVEGGGTLQTYSVDVDNPTQDQAGYEEAQWRSSSLHANRNAGRIRWILRHSYPQVNNLNALAKASGARRLTPETAAAGTQVAIWRYSDDAHVKAADPAAEKLADHLRRTARTLKEPKASLSLGPADVAGRSGGRIGPVTVHTTASAVSISAAPDAGDKGVRIVGGEGKPVASAHDGAKLYFDVPGRKRPESSALTVEAATKIPVGRVFTGVGERARSQTQIVAGSSQSTVSATADASWAAKGAIPATRIEKDCAKGGVDVTVSNKGDKPFTFPLGREKHEVAPGHTQKFTVPVREDQSYRIAVPRPGGGAKTFSGVLDCATAASVRTSSASAAPSRMQPATVGGDQAAKEGGDADLADTGAHNVVLLLGVAFGLVLIGGVALVAVRGRGTASSAAGSGAPDGPATAERRADSDTDGGSDATDEK